MLPPAPRVLLVPPDLPDLRVQGHLEQERRDTEGTCLYQEELVVFLAALPQRIVLREETLQRRALEQQQREQERQRRLAERAAGNR